MKWPTTILAYSDSYLNEAGILLVNFQQLLVSFQPDIDIRVRTHADQIRHTLYAHHTIQL